MDEGLKKVTDNLRVSHYESKTDFGSLKIPDEVIVEEEPVMKTEDVETVNVRSYNSQTMLRKLRNEYLHWSSTRDWFGMQPDEGRKRKIH